MPRPRFSIALKIAFSSLLPLFVGILFCSLVGVSLVNSRIAVQAQEKVRTDLNTAREVYHTEAEHIRNVVRFAATFPVLSEDIALNNSKRVVSFISTLRKNEELDILTLVDRSGRVLFRARNSLVKGDMLAENQLVARALKGETVAGTDIMASAQIIKEGADLARQATIPLVATPMAHPGTKKIEQAGMFLVASVPVKNRSGTIVGAIYGGVLLNGNNQLVDKIKKIVYEGVQFQGDDVGTATIFLDDVRISTNVLKPDAQRAIGTKLSAEVYDRVMVEKLKWVGRAFVVKDYYFTAYEPISDISGRVVGSLYVGMLEKPYSAVKRELFLLFGLVLLAGSLLGIAVSGFISSRLARPIRELMDMVKRFTSGERGVQIKVISNDEVGDLADEFNSMSKALVLQDEQIHRLNRYLQEKVQERTAELEKKNVLLEQTREELVRAEKLAAVGELAAGVAHEINSPMAIIRGNAELLQMELPEEHPSREEVDIIAQQVSRVERIVASLLQFARKEQKNTDSFALEQLLEEILGNIKYLAPPGNITIIRNYAAEIPPLAGDPHQLRQVFTNLIINALQAMTEGGELTVATAISKEADSCQVLISDSGSGITQENLEHIFNPFFTTKASGTGLGLAVSYGIVKDHGGDITVQSEIGKGSRFTVTLPLG